MVLIYEPWSRALLQHQALGPGHFALIMIAPLTLLAAEEARKLWVRRRRGYGTAPASGSATLR